MRRKIDTAFNNLTKVGHTIDLLGATHGEDEENDDEDGAEGAGSGPGSRGIATPVVGAVDRDPSAGSAERPVGGEAEQVKPSRAIRTVALQPGFTISRHSCGSKWRSGTKISMC